MSRLTYENNQASSGAYIHFQNMQAEDLFLFGVLLDVQSCKINKGVHRIFKQSYKYVSLFSMAQIYHEINSLKLGQKGGVTLNTAGDMIYQLHFTCRFPAKNVSQVVIDESDKADTSNLTYKRFGYVTNLGPSIIKNSTIAIDTIPMDQNNTDNIIVLNNLFRKHDQLKIYNEYIGNTKEHTQLKASHDEVKILTPFRLFFSESTQKSFPFLRAGQPQIRINIEMRSPQLLVNCTRNIESTSWETELSPDTMGFITDEIFLNEHERIIHVNTDAHYLIEQNMNYQSSGATTVLEPNFIHPVRFYYWMVKKAKYTTGKHYLAIEPYLDGEKMSQDNIIDATIRFILKYASYTAAVNLEDCRAAALTSAAEGIDFTADTSVNVDIEFTTDENGIILSMFNSGNVAIEQNAQTKSIDAIFQRIQAKAISTGEDQLFSKHQSMIFTAQQYLTEDEISTTIEEWQTHVPVHPGFGLSEQKTIATSVYSEFSIFSQGRVKLKSFIEEGSVEVAVLVETDTKNGSTFFSTITKDNKFNYGLNSFDIKFYAWDNYCKNLDKTGELLASQQLLIGSQPRDTISSFYTQGKHQMQFFEGKNWPGVNLYTFSLDNSQIQPTGSLNFTKSSPKIKIAGTNIEQDDEIFVSAVVYNVIDFKEHTFQTLYSTPMLQ